MASTTTTATGGSGTPTSDEAGAGRRRSGRALLLAAGGLALAGAMLVLSLPPAGGDADPRRPVGQSPLAVPAQEGGDIGAVAEPETCEEGVNAGLNAATSYRPDGIAGDAVERIQERGQLIVGVDQNSYRWGYRSLESEDGGDTSTSEIVGFDIDLVRAIAESLLGEDPSILFKAIPTAQREPAIESGDVDMVVRSMSITCDRWERVAFSAAYFETGQQLLAPITSGITGVDESLAGRRVCAGDETTALDQLRQRQERLPDMEIVVRDGHLDCLVALQLGEADALMTDSALAAGHAAQDPTVHLVGDPVTVESYGVAMNLDDVDLVRWVNGVLEDYTAGGALSAWQESYDDWLADYMPTRQDPPEPLYRD
ncbi:glutamate ABC transporter substrate-binding protein [Streptomyces sp. 4N509B]|uniref:glutamate ABC transporter substrate-binding protein n=1 Tax=Streptomyces sp. 4N509B TaxID=3457413 RepID=UPI003FD2D8D5